MEEFKKFSLSWVVNQLKLNSVGLVSLATALFGISYNTWLDYHNEQNHNMRLAAFEILRDLSELQTVVDYAHFAGDKSKGNPIDGWKNVVMVRDLSRLINQQSLSSSEQLFDAWQQNWEDVGSNEKSEQVISKQIIVVRKNIIDTIENLN